MRVLATALVSLTIAVSVPAFRMTYEATRTAPTQAPSTQAPPPQTPAPEPPRRRPRIVVELSDMLTHSRLVGCRASDARASGAPAKVRLATWNIRAAQSAPVEMLASEMRAMEADVFALQEVDVGTRRGGFVDEPGQLAAALGFQYVFAASIEWDEGHYGLAVLSRFPLSRVRRHRVDSTPDAEPRIVLDATICVAGRPLRVLNHHADRRTASRALGFAHLRRIVDGDMGRGIFVLADLNEYPDAPGIRSLIEMGFVDLAEPSPSNTVGTGRVDYVLADRPLASRASAARVWTTDKSDHHAVLTDIDW